MTQEDYISQRLDDQINWYEGKSSVCQKKHKLWQVIKITAALSITTLSLWSSVEDEIVKFSLWFFEINMPQIIGIIAAFIVFIESFVKIYDYEKLWIQYRTASEKLKREKLLFETRTNPYHTSDAFSILVQHCEAIMQNEVQGWVEMLSEKEAEQ
ncbi:DUF4231 domain-containing protein [Flavobacteriaceae bacterium LMO-SS05]